MKYVDLDLDSRTRGLEDIQIRNLSVTFASPRLALALAPARTRLGQVGISHLKTGLASVYSNVQLLNRDHVYFPSTSALSLPLPPSLPSTHAPPSTPQTNPRCACLRASNQNQNQKPRIPHWHAGTQNPVGPKRNAQSRPTPTPTTCCRSRKPQTTLILQPTCRSDAAFFEV
jgi:hypothetical protein